MVRGTTILVSHARSVATGGAAKGLDRSPHRGVRNATNCSNLLCDDTIET